MEGNQDSPEVAGTFDITVELQRVFLRKVSLFAFACWLPIGFGFWWYITSIPRAPMPSISEFPVSARVLSAIEARDAAAAASNRKNAVAAKAGAKDTREDEAFAAKVAAAAAATALIGSHRNNAESPAEHMPPSPTARHSRTFSAADLTREESFSLLPPLTLAAGLRLLPLCSAAVADAAIFYEYLLNRSRAVKPLSFSLFSSSSDSPLTEQQQQQEGRIRKPAETEDVVEKHLQEQSDSSENTVFFTVNVEALFGDKEEEKRRLWLEQHQLKPSHLSLLRVELSKKPLAADSFACENSGICTPGNAPVVPFPPAAAAVVAANEAALFYTILFVCDENQKQKQQLERDFFKSDEDQRTKEKSTKMRQPFPKIVMQADASAVVCSSSFSNRSEEEVNDKIASTSFAVNDGAEALFQLLRATVFKPSFSEEAAAAGAAAVFGQYELSFWLAGDPPLQHQQKKPQNSKQKQPQREEETRAVRWHWDFEKEVMQRFLVPFFRRMKLLFDFPNIQSQVVSLSGISSLLKPVPSFLAGSNANAAVGEGEKSAGAAAKPVCVLDLASQHHLHAVASRWQPEQIVSAPTFMPSPLLNFVLYKPPVSTAVLHAQQQKLNSGNQFTAGVLVPGWGALVIGSPSPHFANSQGSYSAAKPAAAAAKSSSPVADVKPTTAARTIEEDDKARDEQETFEAFSAGCGGCGGVGEKLPGVAATDLSGAGILSKVSAEELQYASGMWIAQMRSLFGLPATLLNYFPSFSNEEAHSLADAAVESGAVTPSMCMQDSETCTASASARREAAAASVSARAAVAAARAGNGWTYRGGASSGSVFRSEEGAPPLLLQFTHAERVAVDNAEAAAEEKAAVGAASDIEATTLKNRRAVRALEGRKAAELASVSVFLELAPAGVGLWELWKLTHRVYVQFFEQALRNIRSLLTIINSLPELAVLPHINEAVERGLLFLECSAQAAVLRRICPQLPHRLHNQLLERDEGEAADGADAIDAAASGSSIISNARYLFFSLALARAALQDSYEALHDASVTAESHFGIESKSAVYLPFSLPFVLPVALGFLRLRRQERRLKTLAEAARST